MNRTRRVFTAAISLAYLAALAPGAWANAGGAPPFSSGGPFPGENACTRCHVGSEANSGPGSLDILINGAPASEYMYSPGETVALIVKFAEEGAVRVGFQLTVRSGDGCGQPGSLAGGASPAASLVSVRTGNCQSTGSQVQFATQRRPATGDSVEFEVAWTTPDDAVGPVTVAVAVNGANGDASPRGDHIYTSVATLQPMSVPTSPPTISEGGVILADLFSRTETGAPGAIAAAQGAEFAPEGTDATSGVDQQGRVGSVLDGVCVEVNQRRAPVLHLLPEQVNFQIPVSGGIGASTVQVIRACDTPEELRSNIAPFQIAAVQPVFFLFSEDPPTAALHLDSTLVAEADAVPGWPSRPASPGDIVTLFGTGFGAVEPALESGELSEFARGLVFESLRPMIGEMEVGVEDIMFAGAAANFAGLYQLLIRIPDTVPEGRHSFSVLLDGVQSPVGPELVVGPASDEPPACELGLVVRPGESCRATVSGIVVDFVVDEEGAACVNVEALNIKLCGEDAIDLNSFGASVEKNADGSWTVAKLP